MLHTLVPIKWTEVHTPVSIPVKGKEALDQHSEIQELTLPKFQVESYTHLFIFLHKQS